MPEGHTIHRIARDHGKLLRGRRLRVSSPQGRFEDGAQRLDGQRLERIEPYGKHLFYRWSSGDLLHVHLGLFGKYRVTKGVDVPAVGQVRLRLEAGAEDDHEADDHEADDREPLTVDLRGPTDCSIVTATDREAILDRLGPDPLHRDADPSPFLDRVARTPTPIGSVLLNQAVVAGVGNVYRAEALFVTGVHPTRPGRTLDPDQRHSLWTTLAGMLEQGVKDNRIVTVARAELGLSARARIPRSGATYVYKRQVCLRCGSPIQWFELANRTCYACPTCQT